MAVQFELEGLGPYLGKGTVKAPQFDAAMCDRILADVEDYDWVWLDDALYIFEYGFSDPTYAILPQDGLYTLEGWVWSYA